MEHIPYFRIQAKNLLKDYKTRYFDESRKIYLYHSSHFDIGDLFRYFDFPDDREDFSFTLQNAQHLVAKMVGFNKWDDLIHASESELELARFLLERFKDSQDVQYWEEIKSFTGIEQYGAETMLEYARQHYELGDRQSIVNLPEDRIVVLSGKERKEALKQFDDEHNPAGLLRLDSVVYCSHCRKSFEFSKSKVIKDKETNRTMVVCKNYPECKCTYLDLKVLTPTILNGDAKDKILEDGIRETVVSIPKKGSFRMKMESIVRCEHCGEEYIYKDAKVVVSPDSYDAHIHCKNYPECDGDLMDLIGVDNLVPYDKDDQE